MVENKLNKLTASKSTGSDVFHPQVVLKELSNAINVPLNIIFSSLVWKVHYHKHGRVPT